MYLDRLALWMRNHIPDIHMNLLGPSDANMQRQIILIFWYQIWVPREISIRMNNDLIIISYSSQQGKLQLRL